MIAANQPVFSEFCELKTTSQLADAGDFVVVGYDPKSRRMRAMKARAEAAGKVVVYSVQTDKGIFHLSADQAVRLSSGEYIPARSLTPGLSLHAASIDCPQDYIRVHLQNGRKGKELMHRMVAALHGWKIEMRVIHHRDENKWNNRPENLEVTSQSEHASHHGKKQAEAGVHLFQTKRFSHAGNKNGMHSSSAFWKNSPESTSYRETQGRILKSSGRASAMQSEAAKQKRCNSAFRIINAGRCIETFEEYYEGYKAVIGPVGHSKDHIRNSIDKAFGSFEQFVKEVARRNHRVVAIAELGVAEVYSVTVDSKADDAAEHDGNFLIMPMDATSPVGSGILVAGSPA